MAMKVGDAKEYITDKGAVCKTYDILTDDGAPIGRQTEKTGRGRRDVDYTGAPCLARVEYDYISPDMFCDAAAPAAEAPVLAGKTAVVCQTMRDAEDVTAAVQDAEIYITCGRFVPAVNAGMRELRAYDRIVFYKTDMTATSAAKLQAVIGQRTRVCLPLGGADTYQAINMADVPLPERMRGFSGVRRVDRQDVEKIETPWGCLNAPLQGGIPRGQVTLISSKSGSGKSTITAQIIGAAAEQGHKILVYSGEMTPEDLAGILTKQIAGRDYMETMHNAYGMPYRRVTDAAYDDIMDRVIVPHIRMLDDALDHPWTSFLSDVQAAAVAGYDVLVVDNIMTLAQLVMAERHCTEMEAQGLAANALEKLAISNNIYIISIAHMRKSAAGYNGGDKNDEIMGASALANAAGTIIFFERYVPPKKSDEEADEAESETKRVMRLTKNRLFGRTEQRGWLMDYDYDTQRTYDVRDVRALQRKSRWAKDYQRRQDEAGQAARDAEADAADPAVAAMIAAAMATPEDPEERVQDEAEEEFELPFGEDDNIDFAN